MIKVYFECNGYAEIIACFEDEETYIACTPALKKLAKKSRMTITESED